MKYILQLGFLLLIICAIASGILAFVNSKTQPVITERKIKEEEETRRALLPQAVTFEKNSAEADSSFIYYVARDSTDNIIGFAFIASKSGYSSIIKSMVALSTDFQIINMKVIDQNETPGLGSNCTNDEFPKLFKDLGYENLMVDKDGGPITSLTGATITTRAITNSIKESINLLNTDLETKPLSGGTK